MSGTWKLAIAACGIVVLAAIARAPAAEPADVAAQADKQLRTEVPFASTTKTSPGRVRDEIFLRRISLDLVGRVPTPEQIVAFVLDPSRDKRDKAVQKLLADSRYGENWGRYWRDVIMYRKTEERAQIIAGPLESYLVASLNENKPWSQVATDFITALGSAEENGAVGLIMAQQGQPEEVTAEVSRIFLGVQIQCAQCHDHPTDRWKREQFHELAAFFPRVASRLILMQDRRTTEVVANDSAIAGRFRGPMNMRRFGTPEHHMPDLKDPQAQGTLMTPVLFATGQKLDLGTKDAERRGSLAKWITAKDNPYFAKAFVNRMWSELCGEGFYEPVDDMGPDRHATAPQTLDYLAGQFAASGYDVKWLLRTIMATEMYQLPSAPRRGPEEPPFQAAVAQRLRADQLLDNLLHVLEASEPAAIGPGRPGGGLYRGFGQRGQFNAAFGYDPSQRRDEIAGSIPQALAMMNSPMINGAMRGTGQTMLARLLAEIKDDKGLVQELYLKTLAREPSQSELTTCLLFVKQVDNRTEAFEDILWGLVNSTEFLHRS
ncbi:MAG: DUF1549 and DUF1553 domain-containing protein [Planctomycetaceae bacterium]|nr:DUF1549 and DUF1553 domain-containing protein [Planctomycetaceae bacterium]